MRTVIAVAIVIVALAAAVLLLMRDGEQLWLLAIGAISGILVGGVRYGRRGAWIGAAVGCMLGFLAPFLYVPFWLVFSLPPYLEHDL
jgi:hypothetical protein